MTEAPAAYAEEAATLYQAQAATAEAAAARVAALWATINLADIEIAWAEIREQVMAVIAAAQTRAAATAAAYLQAVLDRRGLRPLSSDRIDPLGFAGYTGEGLPLLDPLDAAPIWIKQGIAQGLPPGEASAKARYRAEMLARTEAQRAGSRAQFVGRNLEPRFVGFERYVSLPACSRCILLAGRRYRKNADFDRHPNCDCAALELTELDADFDPASNEPSALFQSMSHAEQDRIFTADGARAIRSGADLSQVVNARLGATGLTPAGARITKAEAEMLRGGLKKGRLRPTRVHGRDVFITSTGTTVRATAGKRLAATGGSTKRPGDRYRTANAPRLMPESIAEIAGDDEEMFRTLLRRFGYIL